MFKLRMLFLCTVALLLSACATSTEVVNQRVASIPEAARSYVIGTYAVDCTPRNADCFHAFNSISTYYRNVDDKEIRGFLNWTTGSVFGNDTTHDYQLLDQREKGYYFCLALPAGKYEVYTYDFYNFAGGGSGYTIREEAQFKLPFAISTGEVIDIGKLHITTSTGKNFFGMTLPAPGILLLGKSTPEATVAALGKCPLDVRSRTIRDASLLSASQITSPFVRYQAPR